MLQWKKRQEGDSRGAKRFFSEANKMLDDPPGGEAAGLRRWSLQTRGYSLSTPAERRLSPSVSCWEYHGARCIVGNGVTRFTAPLPPPLPASPPCFPQTRARIYEQPRRHEAATDWLWVTLVLLVGRRIGPLVLSLFVPVPGTGAQANVGSSTIKSYTKYF